MDEKVQNIERNSTIMKRSQHTKRMYTWQKLLKLCYHCNTSFLAYMVFCEFKIIIRIIIIIQQA